MSTDTSTSPYAPDRTMIICVPAEVPDDALTSRRMAANFGVTGSTSRRFWTLALRPWHRSRLIDLKKGRPDSCAGGPVRLLDLAGVRHAAGMGAGLRYQQWAQLVRGTKPATPWSVLLGRHHADPGKYPLAKARAEFEAQPRVQAMLLHNAAAYGADRLDLTELGMLQAGAVAYQHYRALTQVCGDGLLTADGHQITPASDEVADRARYLETARTHLETLDPTARLLAVTL